MSTVFTTPASIRMANAPTVLQGGLAALAAGVRMFDFAATTQADSSAVSLCLAWQRAAIARGQRIDFVNLNPSLQALAHVYDVQDMLGLAGKTPEHHHH